MNAGPVDPPLLAVRDAVNRALAEDVLPLGDLTASLVPVATTGRATFVSRAEGVVAGRLCALEAFAQIDPSVVVDWKLDDGSPVVAGSLVGTVCGPLRSILTAERTALNFLCHLSGVASLAARYVAVVSAANPATRVLDTRKTTPGLRTAGKSGRPGRGAFNHRGNLSEAVLVKDNHLGGLTVADAVSRARQWWPGRMVEVECDRADQVPDAVDAGAAAVLLDNMTPAQVASCVALVRAAGAAVLVEVSGATPRRRRLRYAAAGADLISVGAITHSAPVLDLGLDLEEA